jgi:hypothetical protein
MSGRPLRRASPQLSKASAFDYPQGSRSIAQPAAGAKGGSGIPGEAAVGFSSNQTAVRVI